MDQRSLRNLVIPGWMVFDLDLTNTEQRMYAIIYGFSQDGESRFYGSLDYLGKWCKIKHRGNVARVLRSLLAKGLIRQSTEMMIGKGGRPVPKRTFQAVVPYDILSQGVLKME